MNIAGGVINLTDFLQLSFNGLAIGSIYAIIALGFIFSVNSVKIVNLAHGELLMVGAFFAVTAIEIFHLPVILGYIVAILGSALFGYILNLTIFKPLVGKPFFSRLVVTMGLSMMLVNLAMNIWGPYPVKLSGPFTTDTFRVGDVAISNANVLIIATLIVLLILLMLFYKKTLTGRQMRAMSEQPDAARLLGVPVRRLTTMTFMVAAGLAAVAGVLMGPIYFVNYTMGGVALMKGFTAAIIGGFGKVEGAVIGGITLGIAETMLAAYVSTTFKDGFAFMALVLILLIRPQGIFGESFSERISSRN